jgi:exodeoxyribonuclease VII small subunit
MTDNDTGDDDSGERSQREPSDDESVSERIDRVEEIVARIERGEVSLDQARDLHAEGHDLLDELESELDLGDADVSEQ